MMPVIQLQVEVTTGNLNEVQVILELLVVVLRRPVTGTAPLPEPGWQWVLLRITVVTVAP